jgi:hypothetical protein
MSGWTATECAGGLRAPTGIESEEDGRSDAFGVRNQQQMFNCAGTGSIWVTAASCAVVGASIAGGAGAIVGGLLGLMLADHVFRNYRFIRRGEREVGPRLPRLWPWRPRPFL